MAKVLVKNKHYIIFLFLIRHTYMLLYQSFTFMHSSKYKSQSIFLYYNPASFAVIMTTKEIIAMFIRIVNIFIKKHYYH